MISTAEVLCQALQLPAKDRAAVAHQLLQSLEPEDADADAVASAWQQEIETRLERIAAGTHKTHDWRQSIEEIRQELKDARP
jgi:Putative addiction module component